jgi:hypothetical protein
VKLGFPVAVHVEEDEDTTQYRFVIGPLLPTCVDASWAGRRRIGPDLADPARCHFFLGTSKSFCLDLLISKIHGKLNAGRIDLIQISVKTLLKYLAFGTGPIPIESL